MLELQRGRPERRFLDVVKEDKRLVGVTDSDAEDGVKWKQMVTLKGKGQKKIFSPVEFVHC